MREIKTWTYYENALWEDLEKCENCMGLQKTEAWEEWELGWKYHLSQFLKEDLTFARQTRRGGKTVQTEGTASTDNWSCEEHACSQVRECSTWIKNNFVGRTGWKMRLRMKAVAKLLFVFFFMPCYVIQILFYLLSFKEGKGKDSFRFMS